MERKSRVVYKDITKVENYRELIQMVESKYAKNVAYRYKKDYTAKEPEYIQKTYEETINNVKAVGTKFIELGLQGKKIILIGKNRYEWCVSYFAITTSNMIVAEAIIFDKKFVELVKKIKKENKKIKTLISMQDVEDKDVNNFSDILKQGKKLLEEGNKEYEKIEIDSNKMSIMLFTSGTTNLPKIVMLSQNNICSNISSIAAYVKIYPTDTLLSFLPIHHTFESTITFLYGFYSGATVAFCDGLRYIQKNLQEYKVSVFVAVPLVLETMYKKIQKAIEDKGKTKLINTISKISNILLKLHIDLRKIFFKQVLDNFGGNLRVVLYGAAPMNKETIIGYNNFGIDLIQGYGLTETSPVISAETDKEKRPGSVGLVLDNLEAKIDNPDKDGVGEILVKGPSVMLGYYENEEETNKAMEDGWFHTGDYGYIDEDKFLYVTGRKKDIIVLKNGKNVYPQEIEFLINKIPGVIESLVYLREKDSRDTMLCAKIVYDKEMLKQIEGDKTQEEYKKEIWKKVKEMNKTLPIYKRIKNITLSTELLSKTTTQKVKRYEELKKVDK